MYWADVTVPSAITFIGVPVLAAISRPVCVDDLILLLTPYLDDIVPVIGNVAISIPFILAISSVLSTVCVFSATLFFATSNSCVLISSAFSVIIWVIVISCNPNCSFIVSASSFEFTA